MRSKADVFKKVKKEAVTDAVKRALRLFGEAVGLCVYDQAWHKFIERVKPEPVSTKPETKLTKQRLMNADDLYRFSSRPQSEPAKQEPNSPSRKRKFEEVKADDIQTSKQVSMECSSN
jgi:recombination DNA repair RAD52 pathway protein